MTVYTLEVACSEEPAGERLERALSMALACPSVNTMC